MWASAAILAPAFAKLTVAARCIALAPPTIFDGRFARLLFDDIGAGSSAFESEHNSAASPHTRPSWRSSPQVKSSARHLRCCRICVSLSCVVFAPAQRCVYSASQLYMPRSRAAAKYAPAGPEA